MDVRLRNLLIIGILVVILSIAYYFLIFLPNFEKQKFNYQVSREKEEKEIRKNCYNLAVIGNLENFDKNLQSCLLDNGLK